MLLSVAALLGCQTAPTRSRLNVALIVPNRRPETALLIEESLRAFMRKNQRLKRRPKVYLQPVSWSEFLRDDRYLASDALIYISLLSELPSKSNNPLMRQLEDLPQLDHFSRFSKPKLFVWVLFESSSLLDQYRFRYPNLDFHYSEAGKKAIDTIIEDRLLPFLNQLQELYS